MLHIVYILHIDLNGLLEGTELKEKCLDSRRNLKD